VNIAQLQYDAARSGYQSAADQYNLTVEAAAKEPETAPSQDVLDRLKLSMETAYYAAEIGRLQLELAKNGADKGSLSVAYARVAQAKAALEQLQAPFTDLQTQQADLAVTQAQLALDQARLRASWAELTAPFDGVVATVNVKVGEPAAGSAPAVVLIDPAHYYLDVAVNEIDVAQLAAGQAAAVSVDALSGRQLTGTVQSLAPVPTAGGNPVNYVVRIVLEPLAATPGQPAAPRLRSGMSALAQIAVAEARDVLLAPNWSIRRDRRTGQAYASLKVGDQVTEVPITTGLRGDQYTEVTSGLQEGDTVAVGTQSTVPFDAGE
jgi:HlyD family secretion protein